MRLEHIPLERAAGTILAHAMRLPGGAVFKKGRVLNVMDMAILAAAGHRSVFAAELEAGDVTEDAAAAVIGAAVAGANVCPADAFTGRCNLFAEARGLVLVEHALVNTLNAVHEAVTLATVQPYALVDKADMVATVKIIPFAVERATLDTCITAVVEAPQGALVRVAPLRPHRAALLMTELPGAPGSNDSVQARAARNMRTRLEALDSQLARELECEHTEEAVAGALRELLAAGFAPILIMGASAIVDRRDVIPAGIERAGGHMEHFGMPVDPGNLLLWARCGDTPVVGVPGCARSLKPSGFDWVLERTLAGVPVARADIMAMGVGGLLTEIGTRPQPRDPRRRASRETIAGVVMAAGRSQRMGPHNKLLAEVDGKPMVLRVVDALLASSARPVVVVTGHEDQHVRAALAEREVRVVHNVDYAQGMSTSVRAGIVAVEQEAEAAVVCLGDMPWLAAHHVEALIAAYNPVEGREICVPVHQGKRGNPVLLGARFFAEIKSLTGDMGARRLLERHAGVVHEVPVADTGVLVDVDTMDALAALSQGGVTGES